MSGDGGPVLITGATGFLGSWTIAALVRAGHAVVATDLVRDTRRLDQVLPAAELAAVDWRVCDVTDGDALRAVVADAAPSAIVHLAALQIPACRANPVACAQVNVIGHINVFEAAKDAGVDRIIYTSSAAAKPRGPANAPANLYGVFKKTDEEIARIYWEEHGIPSLGLRPFIVYGVGRDDGETAAITKAIRAAALGEPYAMPFSTRSCLQYAGEVAEIFRRCTEARWQGALVSDLTTETSTTDELIATIRGQVPGAAITPSDRQRVSPSDGFDNGPLKGVIGDWPATSLADGVADTLRRFRELAAGAR
ncbi:MAG: NAD(P)-dependent oxidoreductase [Hyphomicrobiales bacterium]|nr:NAD(P)-dependent oxidoreductase [Hyphomicrobiales bacterium]MCP5373409.1 NAD(P)-dependent oxidoreductase [Hyphomicrobiales bacterium]